MKFEKIKIPRCSRQYTYKLPVNLKKKFVIIGCNYSIVSFCICFHYNLVFLKYFSLSFSRWKDCCYCRLNTDNTIIIDKIVVDIKQNKSLSIASFLKFFFQCFIVIYVWYVVFFALVSVVVTLLNSNRHLVLFFIWQQQRHKAELKNIRKKDVKEEEKKR